MQVHAPIIEHRRIADDIFLLTLSVPDIAGSAEPGQFIHIKCGSSFDPLLRRPFSLSMIDKEAGNISVIYEVRGRGTKILSTCPVGQTLDIMGPLGSSFSISHISPQSGAVLVGGGIGAPPMASLAQALIGKGLKRVTVLLGAASKEKLLPEEIFTRTGAEVLIATDDGSAGYQGFVTELLPSQVSGGEVGTPVVFACGPEGMLKAVGSFCLSNGIPCQLSLESVMACGVGACQGCVCRVLRRGSVEYVRVCTEGPVFDAGEVIWDD